MKKVKVFDVMNIDDYLDGYYKDHLVVLIDELTDVKVNRRNKKFQMWFPVSKRLFDRPIIPDTTKRPYQ